MFADFHNLAIALPVSYQLTVTGVSNCRLVKAFWSYLLDPDWLSSSIYLDVDLSLSKALVSRLRRQRIELETGS